MSRLSPDFWCSKTTWLGLLGATVAAVYALVEGKDGWAALLAAIAFLQQVARRDTTARGNEETNQRLEQLANVITTMESMASAQSRQR